MADPIGIDLTGTSRAEKRYIADALAKNRREQEMIAEATSKTLPMSDVPYGDLNQRIQGLQRKKDLLDREIAKLRERRRELEQRSGLDHDDPDDMREIEKQRLLSLADSPLARFRRRKRGQHVLRSVQVATAVGEMEA